VDSPRQSALGSRQTVGDLVEAVAARLDGHLPNARAESRELIAALLDVPKHWPLLHENKWVESEVWQRAMQAVRRRAAGAPLAYAVGKADFRGLTLAVDERVLIPRPETESLVDLVLARVDTGIAVDAGTGSGAIALALATEGRFDRVIATDVSRDALEVAAANARAIGATNVEFVAGDLLSALGSRPSSFSEPRRDDGRPPRAESRPPRADSQQLSVVVSNPPYISFSEIPDLPPEVRDWEPPLALFSAGDGMSVTARLVRQAAAHLRDGGLLALEVDARRASLVAERVAAATSFTDVSVQLDYAGRERFVLATRRKGNAK